MKIWNESELKWPLVIRDDVGDWHSAVKSSQIFNVFEAQDLVESKIWDSDGYRIHLHEYFRDGYALSFTRGELEIHELHTALRALNGPSPGLDNIRHRLEELLSEPHS